MFDYIFFNTFVLNTINMHFEKLKVTHNHFN